MSLLSLIQRHNQCHFKLNSLRSRLPFTITRLNGITNIIRRFSTTDGPFTYLNQVKTVAERKKHYGQVLCMADIPTLITTCKKVLKTPSGEQVMNMKKKNSSFSSGIQQDSQDSTLDYLNLPTLETTFNRGFWEQFSQRIVKSLHSFSIQEIELVLRTFNHGKQFRTVIFQEIATHVGNFRLGGINSSSMSGSCFCPTTSMSASVMLSSSTDRQLVAKNQWSFGLLLSYVRLYVSRARIKKGTVKLGDTVTESASDSTTTDLPFVISHEYKDFVTQLINQSMLTSWSGAKVDDCLEMLQALKYVHSNGDSETSIYPNCPAPSGYLRRLLFKTSQELTSVQQAITVLRVVKEFQMAGTSNDSLLNNNNASGFGSTSSDLSMNNASEISFYDTNLSDALQDLCIALSTQRNIIESQEFEKYDAELLHAVLDIQVDKNIDYTSLLRKIKDSLLKKSQNTPSGTLDGGVNDLIGVINELEGVMVNYHNDFDNKGESQGMVM